MILLDAVPFYSSSSYISPQTSVSSLELNQDVSNYYMIVRVPFQTGTNLYPKLIELSKEDRANFNV